MNISPLLDQLIEAFQVLPGVGPKSAQRMVLNLLQHNRDGGRILSALLERSMQDIGYCTRCRSFSESDICALCSNLKRDPSLLCVVESPADIMAIEHSGGFQGFYFVLHGRLSPIDGIGPEELGISLLQARAGENEVEEVILATNPTVEGEATAHYISQALEICQVNLSRIAHGVPIGGELEYIDDGTIIHAFNGRKQML